MLTHPLILSSFHPFILSSFHPFILSSSPTLQCYDTFSVATASHHPPRYSLPTSWRVLSLEGVIFNSGFVHSSVRSVEICDYAARSLILRMRVRMDDRDDHLHIISVMRSPFVFRVTWTLTAVHRRKGHAADESLYTVVWRWRRRMEDRAWLVTSWQYGVRFPPKGPQAPRLFLTQPDQYHIILWYYDILQLDSVTEYQLVVVISIVALLS